MTNLFEQAVQYMKDNDNWDTTDWYPRDGKSVMQVLLGDLMATSFAEPPPDPADDDLVPDYGPWLIDVYVGPCTCSGLPPHESFCGWEAHELSWEQQFGEVL